MRPRAERLRKGDSKNGGAGVPLQKCVPLWTTYRVLGHPLGSTSGVPSEMPFLFFLMLSKLWREDPVVPDVNPSSGKLSS